MPAGPFPPFLVIENFLSADTRAALLDLMLENQGAFEPTKVSRDGRQVIEADRRVSHKLAFPPGDLQRRFLDRVQEAAPAMLTKIGMSPFPVARYELELIAHNDGAHFARHLDTITQVTSTLNETDRVVSGVYYFFREPKGFTGGNLRLFRFGSNDDAVEIRPVQNSFVVFPSFALHEVTRVACPTGRFEDSRFAVNCWLRRKR